MIYYKTQEEIELIRHSCLLVCRTLAHVGSLLKPGAIPARLDQEAESFIRDHHGIPAFKGYRGFPGTLCFSVNEVVVHGIPGEKAVQEGDIVSVDCGVQANGYYGDSAYTFVVGDIPTDVMQLLAVTRASLYKGIEQAIEGNRIGDIAFAIQNHCESQGYGVVRELVGHGIGQHLHESPEVPNYGRRGQGLKIKPGLVIAIEPMVNKGRKEVRQLSDGWTIITKDRMPAAHYEHTIAVREEGPADILSDHSFIEEAIQKNTNLRPVTLGAMA